jgi:hypothetical protein
MDGFEQTQKLSAYNCTRQWNLANEKSFKVAKKTDARHLGQYFENKYTNFPNPIGKFRK